MGWMVLGRFCSSYCFSCLLLLKKCTFTRCDMLRYIHSLYMQLVIAR